MVSKQTGIRIIAGALKGRKLKPPAGVRPTTDRAREALFSTLLSFSRLEGAVVLDLYAGSGALGLEALSRGAASAWFVEKDEAVGERIRRAAEDFRVAERTKVHIEEVMPFLRRLSCAPVPACFDIVFADPPYAEHPGAELPAALGRCACVKQKALVVVEAPEQLSGVGLLPASGGFEILKVRRYGAAVLTYLCRL